MDFTYDMLLNDSVILDPWVAIIKSPDPANGPSNNNGDSAVLHCTVRMLGCSAIIFWWQGIFFISLTQGGLYCVLVCLIPYLKMFLLHPDLLYPVHVLFSTWMIKMININCLIYTSVCALFILHILICSTWQLCWVNGWKLVIFSSHVSNFGTHRRVRHGGWGPVFPGP